MSDEKRYIKNDLIDYADLDQAREIASSHGEIYLNTREDYIRASLPETAKVQMYSTGGYQGQKSYVIRLDGYIWLFQDHYGSCGHCDSFMDRKRSWTEDMLRKAYCFETEDDALAYLGGSEEYGWRGLRNATKKMIEDPDENSIGHAYQEAGRTELSREDLRRLVNQLAIAHRTLESFEDVDEVKERNESLQRKIEDMLEERGGLES